MTPGTRKQGVLALLLAMLLSLGILVLRPFLVSMTWALIIAYVSWPVHQRMQSLTNHRRSISALLTTSLVTVVLVVPILLLALPLSRESVEFAHRMAAWFSDQHHTLPRLASSVPWLGVWLQAAADDIGRDARESRALLAQWGNHAMGAAAQLAANAGRNALKFGFAVLTLFFVYRDGRTVLDQLRLVFEPLLGKRFDVYLASIGEVCRAVAYGVVLTATAQGTAAGIGYWVAGVEAPLLLSVLTALAALFPFGTPFVWVPVGLALLLDGRLWAGVGLLAWGTLAISGIDNLVRPLLISGGTRMPFLLAVFSILGGITAFGFVGFFLGPIVVATLLAVWREWGDVVV